MMFLPLGHLWVSQGEVEEPPATLDCGTANESANDVHPAIETNTSSERLSTKWEKLAFRCSEGSLSLDREYSRPAGTAVRSVKPFW